MSFKEIKRPEDRKMPLLISWALTNKCNQRCLYCRVWNVKCNELNTREIFSIVNELALMGTVRICLTGGEPLLRDDLGKIVDFIRKKNILIEISSNGSLVKKKITELEGVHLVCLSLDGPEEVHDLLRGKGSYKNVLDTAEMLKINKIAVYFRTVLTKLNLGQIDYILSIANRLKIKFMFQPASKLLYGTCDMNPLAPTPIKYQNAIDKLIIEKKNRNEFICDSLTRLESLRFWPKPRRMFCISGKTFFHIEPNGIIYSCIWGRNAKDIIGRDCLKIGVREAIETLPEISCDGCWNC